MRAKYRPKVNQLTKLNAINTIENLHTDYISFPPITVKQFLALVRRMRVGGC